MAKIIKGVQPETLKKNADEWTKGLLDEYKNQGNDSSKVVEKFWNKYRKEDIKEQLENECHSKCMYCDSLFGTTDFEHIEHIKPKKQNPHLTYSWDNLGWACSRCNQKKGVENMPNPYEIDFEDILEVSFSMLLQPKNETDFKTKYFIDKLELNTNSKLVFNRCTVCHTYEKKVEKLEQMTKLENPNLFYYIQSLKLETDPSKEYYIFKKAILKKVIAFLDLDYAI